MKFEYMIVCDPQNMDRMGAAIHLESGWMPIFNIINLSGDVNLIWVEEQIKKMIQIFDNKAKVNDGGIVSGPSYCELDWNEVRYTAFKVYEEYVRDC